MVKEAEANAVEDKKRRELVEARNSGEGLIHATEKSVAEHGSKLGESDKGAITAAIEALRAALGGEDAEAIRSRTNELMQASMKLGEAMYQASQGEAAPGAAANEPGHAGSKADDVVDADFQEVDADKKKRA